MFFTKARVSERIAVSPRLGSGRGEEVRATRTDLKVFSVEMIGCVVEWRFSYKIAVEIRVEIRALGGKITLEGKFNN